MQNLQIKLLYEQYGWPAERIAELLGMSPSTIRLIIEEQQFVQLLAVRSVAETQTEIEALKSTEVSKQQHLTPVMTAIELSLFGKIMEISKECETPHDLANVVKAYKMLTQDAIVNAVVREEKASGKAPTIAVQIINEVA